MRSVYKLPFDARRLALSLLSVSSVLVLSCSSSGTNSSKPRVHCTTDADCPGAQVCGGDVCTDLQDVDTGAPSKPMKSGTGGHTTGNGGQTSTGTCGDGVAEGGEACDGTDLRGESCATATMNPAISGTLSCTSTCAFDLRACRISPDAGVVGRGGAGGGFGFGGTGGLFGAGGYPFGSGGAPFGGGGSSGSTALSPPVPCGNTACPDPLTGASPDTIAALKSTAPSACCLDDITGTCGRMFSSGTCTPIPPPDLRCPTAGSTFPPGATYPCCMNNDCGLSLYGTSCTSLSVLSGIGAVPPPQACDAVDAGTFGAQP